jgi:hypothetical protein
MRGPLAGGGLVWPLTEGLLVRPLEVGLVASGEVQAVISPTTATTNASL